MKKSLVIATVLGIAVAAGVVWYIENNKKTNEKNDEPIKSMPNDEIPTYSELNEQKSAVASTISERHSVAAQIIKESLEESNTDVSKSNHKVDFDEIDSSLDNLLDEE